MSNVKSVYRSKIALGFIALLMKQSAVEWQIILYRKDKLFVTLIDTGLILHFCDCQSRTSLFQNKIFSSAYDMSERGVII